MHKVAVFMSPPWGGMSYLKKGQAFDIDKGIQLGAVGGRALLRLAQGVGGVVGYFLPRNIEPQEVNIECTTCKR